MIKFDEEPDAGIPHVRICRGRSRKGLVYQTSYQDYEIQTYPDGANEKVESVTIRSSEYEASGNVQIGSDIRSLENEVSDTEIIKTPRIWFYEKENFGIRYFYDSDHKVNAIEVYKIVEGK